MTNTKFVTWLNAALVSLVVAVGATPGFAQEETVNIYSYREPGLIQPVLDLFTQKTGITTKLLFAKNGLIERALAEGENSPVDVILTVDIGTLVAAKEMGLSQTLTIDALETLVPSSLRDSDNQWTALTMRARVFYVSRERVSEISLNYDDVAGLEWTGRVCTRSGQHPYSIALIASRIAHLGADKAETWLEGVRDNLVSRPTGNDRAQIKSIFSGACDLAIGNTYYMGLMLNNDANPEQKEWANAVRIIYPDADGVGTHVNISGALMAANAPNKNNAEALIEFLLSDPAQRIYADTNYEFPIVPGVSPSSLVASWGKLVPDTIPLTEIAAQRQAASNLVDKILFDSGPQN